MARFFAYVRADELPNADAEKLSTAIKADVEALVIRTYPGLGLTVDAYVELDEPSLISVPDEPTEPPAPSEPVIPTEPEPAPPVVEPAPETPTAPLLAADGVTELTPVDSTLEADQNVVARDAAGNGYDVNGHVIDPVAAPAPDDGVVDAPIIEEPTEPVDTHGVAVVEPVADPIVVPGETTLPLYVVDGDVNTVHDPAQWPPAGVHTPDGRPLFHFAADIAGGTPAGDGVGGVWHAYDGPVLDDIAQPV